MQGKNENKIEGVQQPGALESSLLGLKPRHYSWVALSDLKMFESLGFRSEAFMILNMGMTSGRGVVKIKGVSIYRVGRIVPGASRWLR